MWWKQQQLTTTTKTKIDKSTPWTIRYKLLIHNGSNNSHGWTSMKFATLVVSSNGSCATSTRQTPLENRGIHRGRKKSWKLVTTMVVFQIYGLGRYNRSILRNIVIVERIRRWMIHLPIAWKPSPQKLYIPNICKREQEEELHSKRRVGWGISNIWWDEIHAGRCEY